jgi:hypothetical protein
MEIVEIAHNKYTNNNNKLLLLLKFLKIKGKKNVRRITVTFFYKKYYHIYPMRAIL